MSLHTPAPLQDKVAVVTGAAGGLGLAMVETLSAQGARVLALDLSPPAADAAPPATPGAPVIDWLRCDVADPASVRAMGAHVRERYGRCDVLVNNAAVAAPATPLEDFPIDLWERMFQVNLRGALLCAQAVAPLMLAQGAGSIVNVSSIAAQVATQVGAYGATKAALRGLTTQMAVEWGPRGLRANSVSPGMIRTPLSEPHYRDPAKLQARTGKIPARRVGVPADIAGVVAFLAGDGAAYVNGQDIVVDGGFLKAALTNLY